MFRLYNHLAKAINIREVLRGRKPMKSKSGIKLAVVAILTVLVSILALNGLNLGSYTISKVADEISLGLDLRGGVYAVYIAPNEGQEDYETLVNGTIAVLRNRLSAQGFNEATVTRQGSNRIRVEIPAVSDPGEILQIIGKPAHLEFVAPDKSVVIEGKDIKKAYAGLLDNGEAVVHFELNDSGRAAFADATAKNIGSVIAITLDDETISAPVVESAIPDGQGYINGMHDVAEAQELAMLIMSGALPLEIEQDELRTVSATLGVNALANCITAGVIGLILVLVFMAAVYRLPGLMADLALVIYILIVMYALAIVPGIQLTLPGIAGILLGIGMAVDANVIIFERFREELAGGADLRRAVKRGFKNALSAVIDSNVTTIIVALVLMYFGTGPIRGFAITLFIGVVASMVTAVFVTRFLLTNVVNLGNGKNLALYTRPLKLKKNDPEKKFFTGRTKVFALVSVGVMALALVLSVLGLGLNPGIEFTGGSLLRYEMGESFEVGDVASALDTLGQSGYQIAKSGEDASQTELQVRLPLTGDSAQVSTKLEENLKASYPQMTFIETEFIGAVAGQDLLTNAILSLLIAFAAILLYIIIRFDFMSGLAAVIALVHDVLIMIAFMAFFRGFFQINSSFIAALLTIVGYSINNTIVIFDRIRELNKEGAFAGKSRLALVEYAVGTTISRTLNTTVTTLLTLVPVFVLAGEIREFTFPMLVGMLAGTYSSVMLSGQIWAMWQEKAAQKKLEKGAKKA